MFIVSCLFGPGYCMVLVWDNPSSDKFIVFFDQYLCIFDTVFSPKSIRATFQGKIRDRNKDG